MSECLRSFCCTAIENGCGGESSQMHIPGFPEKPRPMGLSNYSLFLLIRILTPSTSSFRSLTLAIICLRSLSTLPDHSPVTDQSGLLRILRNNWSGHRWVVNVMAIHRQLPRIEPTGRSLEIHHPTVPGCQQQTKCCETSFEMIAVQAFRDWSIVEDDESKRKQNPTAEAKSRFYLLPNRPLVSYVHVVEL